MSNRDTWDWPALEPDQTVTMTLIFNRTPKDDGRKEGADYDWHRYPVSVGKVDWTMFTPTEFMHSALQALKVNKKGDIFRATKKIDGWNKDTQKQYTYYELEKDGTRFRTDRMESATEEESPPLNLKEAKEKLVPADKPTASNKSTLKEIHKEAYTAVMNNILDYLETYCPKLYFRSKGQDEVQRQERLSTLIVDLQPYISSMVNTLVIEGGKR